MTGLLSMLRILARARWLLVIGWPLALSAVIAGMARAMTDLYATGPEREVYAASVGNSIPSIAFNGRGADLTDPGAIAANELGIFVLLAMPLIGVHLGIALTRGMKAAGQLDIVTAGRVSRTAPAMAGIGLGLIACGLLFATSAGVLIALDLSARGSVRYAAALAAFMAVHCALGWVCGQLSQASRTAVGLGFTVALAWYLLRLVADARSWEPAAYLWATPNGWLAEVHPWGEDARVWPLVAFGAVVAVGLTVTLLIASRRDLGAGVVEPRPGPERAGALLGGPGQLACRLVRGGVLAWLTGIPAFMALFGLIAQEMQHLIDLNPSLQNMISSGIDQLADLVVWLGAMGGAAAGIQVLGVLSAEESAGRVGLVLAAPVSRWRWWTGAVALGLTTSVATTLLGALAIGGSLTWALDDTAWVGIALRFGLAHGAAACVLVAGAALLSSIRPGLVNLSWVSFGWALVVGTLGVALDLPRWATRLAPADWLGTMTRDSVDWSAAVAMLGIAGAAVLVSSGLFRVRPLVAG